MSRCCLRLLLVSVAVFSVSSRCIAAAPPDIDTLASVGGVCQAMQLAGRAVTCQKVRGIIYTHYRHGTVMLSIGLDDGRIMGFVADRDDQPRPEDYWLYLSRIRIVGRAVQKLIKVAGTCKISMSENGMTWKSVKCDAEDANGASYSLQFVGEGPVQVKHFDQNGQLVGTSEHVSANVVVEVSERLKKVLSSQGIGGVSTDVQRCYNSASVSDIAAIRKCLLYDISAFELDQGMMTVFAARGMKPPSASTPFLTKRAFKARMGIYSRFAFHGAPQVAYSFFGNAPSRILNSLGHH